MSPLWLLAGCHLFSSPEIDLGCGAPGACTETGTTPSTGGATTGTVATTTSTADSGTSGATTAPADADGDGWSAAEGDCDDGDPGVHPEAPETCGDGVDQDCDGTDPACPPTAAVVWSGDDAMAERLANTLVLLGFEAKPVDAGDAGAAELAAFDLLVVPPEIRYDWTRAGRELEEAGRPVLAMGLSGYYALGELGLSIGHPHGSHFDGQVLVPLEPDAAIFTSPNELATDDVLKVLVEPWSTTGIPLEYLSADAKAWGTDDRYTGHAVLVSEGAYLFWGWNADPDALTPDGLALLENAAWFLLGAR